MQTQAHTHTTAYNPIPISSPNYNGSKCVYTRSASQQWWQPDNVATTTKKCWRCNSGHNDDGHYSNNHNNKSHETKGHNIGSKTPVTITPPPLTAPAMMWQQRPPKQPPQQWWQQQQHHSGREGGDVVSVTMTIVMVHWHRWREVGRHISTIVNYCTSCSIDQFQSFFPCKTLWMWPPPSSFVGAYHGHQN